MEESIYNINDIVDDLVEDAKQIVIAGETMELMLSRNEVLRTARKVSSRIEEIQQLDMEQSDAFAFVNGEKQNLLRLVFLLDDIYNALVTIKELTDRKNHLAIWLARNRRKYGWSTSQLAQYSGVSTTSITDIEQGQVFTETGAIEKLARAFSDGNADDEKALAIQAKRLAELDSLRTQAQPTEVSQARPTDPPAAFGE